MTELKTIIIDGNKFSNLEEFWDYFRKIFGYQVNYFGRNYNAFDEFLYGGFGPYEDGEHIILIWKNFKKSKKELKRKEMKTLLHFISETHKFHITFVKE